MYVSVKGMSYKAVTEDKDLYASIDKDIDMQNKIEYDRYAKKILYSKTK